MKFCEEYIGRLIETEGYTQLVGALAPERAGVALRGLHGSSFALLVAAWHRTHPGVQLLLLPNHESAAYAYGDMRTITADSDHLFFYPSSYRADFAGGRRLVESQVHRTHLLEHLEEAEREGSSGVVVSYPQALLEGVGSPEGFASGSLRLAVGERVRRVELGERLSRMGFVQVDLVANPGEFARRGAIVDVYSLSRNHPYRLDFAGDTLSTIRLFDPSTQRSVERQQEAVLVPDLVPCQEDNLVLLTERLGACCQVWAVGLSDAIERLQSLEANGSPIPEGLANVAQLELSLAPLRIVENDTHPWRRATHPPIPFSTRPQPIFRRNFSLLCSRIGGDVRQGYKSYLLAEQPSQLKRLADILGDQGLTASDYQMEAIGLSGGFTDDTLRINAFTDHQLFDRYYAARSGGGFKRGESLELDDVRLLRPGDYVVHVDHGVGRFEGLVRESRDGVQNEFVRISYQAHDTVLVNIHNLHRISKYRGKDGEPPTLNRLGGATWANLKARAKRKLKDIARDLIRLYAQRMKEEGFAFSKDTYMQESLESSFMYEDTPDQLRAIGEVKRDMEQPRPMDRLICADVGFGKTEIAVRAAFKAATDGKQVAVLVPTTVLALQHYRTFSERLAEYGCTVEAFSRLKTAAERRKIAEELASGKIDVIVGTHALLKDGLHFHDLGLLVVDEEQKFGVAAKEKLRKLQVGVDTLTLTATPIPRTLQFSLLGARDMSVIATPPPNRQPIRTEVSLYDETLIVRAIAAEMERGGQVFFVHNTIAQLPRLRQMLLRELPLCRCAIAHGQMKPQEIEEVLLAFMAGEYDVLLSTTIVEAGLDIPNANTIIISEAHHFGLSDLHQLRGRVGRSNRKAYCYLLVPPRERMTEEARRRVDAVEQFADLGSGLHIAMQDLDIRGAGNLLGSEQSGFMANLGIDTYYRILEEAVDELRRTEFHELFEEKGDVVYVRPGDCQVETDLAISLPEEFIQDAALRVQVYQDIDRVRSAELLLTLREGLEDRYGALPEGLELLLRVPPLRWQAAALGIERLRLHKNQLSLFFVAPASSPYYQSEIFAKVLHNLPGLGRSARMKTLTDRVRLDVEVLGGFADVENALATLAEEGK